MAAPDCEKNKAQKLSKYNWIVKSNTLNEIRNNAMSIGQQRFFVIYQSKISPSNPKSRLVTFKLSEYIRIMQFKQLNITRLEETAEDLLKLIAKFREPDGGFMMCQIFKQFKLYKGNDDEWYVSIDCHDDVLPYMFELRKYFFKYQLWNALRLSSSNQIRMYEILKQYEHAGAREISVKELREFIGIAPNEYPRWERFKVRVLDSCQQALADNTDIKFTYELIKKGKGGKISALKFTIEKNDDFIDQLTLDEFLTPQEQTPEEPQLELKEFFLYNNERLEFLSDACNKEFNEDEMQLLMDLLIRIIPLRTSAESSSIERYDFLRSKYNELNYRASKKKITNRFGYLKKLLESAADEVAP